MDVSLALSSEIRAENWPVEVFYHLSCLHRSPVNTFSSTVQLYRTILQINTRSSTGNRSRWRGVVYYLSQLPLSAPLVYSNTSWSSGRRLLAELSSQQTQKVWWERQHRMILLRNLWHIQALLHFHRFHCLEIHNERRLKLLIFSNKRLLTQRLPSIDHNQVWHRHSHGARSYFASDTFYVLWKRQVIPQSR